MSRRLELLVYGLVAGIQVLVAWLVYFQHHIHHLDQETPPSAASHLAAPAGSGLGAQSGRQRDQGF